MSIIGVELRLLRLAADPEGGAGFGFERGLGYWITHDDRVVPLPPRMTHAEIACELLIGDGGVAPSVEALDDDARDELAADPNAFAITHGWTRVRIYPGNAEVYADLGSGRELRHRRAVLDLLASLEMDDYRLRVTDDAGNYREVRQP